MKIYENKKKTYYLSLFFSLLFVNIFAQNLHYYYHNNKVNLKLDKSYLNITVNTNFSKSSLDTITTDNIDLIDDKSIYPNPTIKYAKIKIDSSMTYGDYLKIFNTLRNIPGVRTVNPNVIYNNDKFEVSDYVYIKLKSANDYQILVNEAQEKKLSILGQVPSMPLWYVLRCTKNTIEHTLNLSSDLYQTNLFAEVEPDLNKKIVNDINRTSDVNMLDTQNPLTSDTCADDQFFTDQWGLNNTGQYGGIPGIDINICKAWDITYGNNSVVAIIDDGIQSDHPDLQENILRDNSNNIIFYNAELASSSQSDYLIYKSHGTAIAGIIGAKKNNFGIAGVAPNCKLMPITFPYNTSNLTYKKTISINFAVNNGADIINCSWEAPYNSALFDDAVINGLNNGRNGLGVIFVFAAGNSNGYSSNSGVAQLDERINIVGAISQCGERTSFTSCNNEPWGSNFGIYLDIVAPGTYISTTDITISSEDGGYDGYNGNNPEPTLSGETNSNYVNNLDYFSRFSGTSASAPFVAGVVALMLSVNPNLTAEQVHGILMRTANKIRNDIYDYRHNTFQNYGSFSEIGYGLVDAYAATYLAQQMNSSTFDLYIKDRPDDVGIEPNPTSDHMWISEDIWIRNYDDNEFSHQNPEYKSNGNPNYIYVRVINKSGLASTGNETLTINWAKANTALAWPQNWGGNNTPPLTDSDGDPLGGQLQPVNIPVIQPGEETIVKVPWVVPNPDDYSDNPVPWHFCVLAQIDDGNPVTMTSNPNIMVRNSNNLAWKNLTVVDLVQDRNAMVMVANPSNSTRTFYLELFKETNELGKPIFNEAEVTLKMDDVLYNAWVRGGKQEQMLESKQGEKEKLVKGDNVILDNLMMNANEMGLLTLDFNFLTKELTDKQTFTYHVVQKDAQTGEIIGGETFLIKKKQRPIFVADAGNDKEIDKNETITISAEDINEAAVYNWYDMEGNLIYQGKDLTVSADITKKYKLEVITDSDGYKDYDEVEVKLKPSRIINISPNPTTDNVDIAYKLNNVNSAYLMVIGTNSNSNNNYILDVSNENINLDISNYQTGYYTIALVCDGQIVDAKQILKQ